mmetsp:Transcript_1035/g.2573  ORF Transcript_1035/g.2573 Transcript_1035/m.2573 type:complete len:80 (-) Transcript_1035:304-543(-)
MCGLRTALSSVSVHTRIPYGEHISVGCQEFGGGFSGDRTHHDELCLTRTHFSILSFSYSPQWRNLVVTMFCRQPSMNPS